MLIIDNGAFLDHERTIKTINNTGDKELTFTVKLNMPTGIYYKIQALINEYDNTNNIEEKSFYLVSAIALLLNKSVNYIIDNIPVETMQEIIKNILIELQKIYHDDYSLPDIDYKTDEKVPNPDDTEAWNRYRNRQDIKNLNEKVSEHEQIMTAMISYLMAKTNNSYNDIMKMPVMMFWATFRNIALSELRTNDDYNLAYLMNEYAMLQDCGEIK